MAGGAVAGLGLTGCDSPAAEPGLVTPAPSASGAPVEEGIRLSDDLLLGFATAAYQVEGAVRSAGRGPSIWDTFCRRPGVIDDGSSGDVACDHFHRMPADVALMARLRTQTYRFSVAWPRIFPEGRGRLNPQGFDFYRRLVDELRDKGISPLATLYHWDLPQALQDAGGWQNRDVASWFADYAATVFDGLPGVDRWVTINEPKVVVQSGHQRGTMAPGITSDRAAGKVLHHLALAHGRAVQAFRAAGSPGEIGPCIAVTPCYPADGSARAARQTKAADAWQNTVYLDPVLRGRYPDLVTTFAPGVRAGLASVQRDGDLPTISSPVDFVGLNYYSPTVIDGAGKKGTYWPTSASGQQVYADGLYDIATRVYRDYHRPIIITETGIPDAAGVPPLEDQFRIDFLHDHLRAVQRAIDDGVQIRGFHAWSLMDNFEWARGFTQRWGLVHMDFTTQERTPKRSAAWFSDLITSRRLAG